MQNDTIHCLSLYNVKFVTLSSNDVLFNKLCKDGSVKGRKIIVNPVVCSQRSQESDRHNSTKMTVLTAP